MSLCHLITEQRNPSTIDIDTKSTIEILKCINDEDQTVAKIVESQLYRIAEAVDIVVGQLKKDGRLIYVGCGSSGRMGVIGKLNNNLLF